MRLALVGLVLTALVAPASAGAPAFESREYKILLAPGPFADPEAGMRKAWDVARAVAGKLGLRVKDEGFDLEDDRFVAFLDTKDFAARRSGHILRVRRAKEFGRKELEGRKGELTLKFRSVKPGVAAAAVVEPAPGAGGECVYEEDASYGPSGARVVYSKSARVKTDDLPPCTVDGFAKLFPGFGRIGLPGSAPLGRVRGVAIRERRVKPGKVDFGPAKGKVTLSVWLDAPTNRALVGELSFALELDGGVESMAASREADRYAKALVAKFAPALAKGCTKTGLVYGDETATDE